VNRKKNYLLCHREPVTVGTPVWQLPVRRLSHCFDSGESPSWQAPQGVPRNLVQTGHHRLPCSSLGPSPAASGFHPSSTS
jgi:hypothetical protein